MPKARWQAARIRPDSAAIDPDWLPAPVKIAVALALDANINGTYWKDAGRAPASRAIGTECDAGGHELHLETVSDEIYKLCGVTTKVGKENDMLDYIESKGDSLNSREFIATFKQHAREKV